MIRGKYFSQTPCGMVTVTSDAGQWLVWIYDWLQSEHDNEVKAVIMAQKLTLVKRK